MSPSNSSESTLMLVLHILLTLILPPVGVFLKVGIGLHFWLSLVLTLFFFLPGQIHGIWVLLTK